MNKLQGSSNNAQTVSEAVSMRAGKCAVWDEHALLNQSYSLYHQHQEAVEAQSSNLSAQGNSA